MEVLEYNLKFSHIESTLFFGQLIDKDIQVSIIIPTYNRLEAVQVAIESALNQNNHSLLKYEIVVVDNNPESINNKDIPIIVKNWENRNFRYFVNGENMGMMANWNRGIELSRGKWIIQLHDDDYLLPYFIETTHADFGQFKNIQAIVHDTVMFDKRKSETVSINEKKSKFIKLNSGNILQGNSHMTASLVDRKSIYNIGGFDPDMYPISDYDFNQKLIKKYNVVAICNYPLAVIVFEQNETLNPAVFENWFTIARIIKNNAIADLNGFFRFFLKKVIEHQINIDITNIKDEIIMNEQHKKELDQYYIKTSLMSKILWRVCYHVFVIYNFSRSKNYIIE